MKVWVVDDDDFFHLLVNRIVKKGNFDVSLESYFDGKQAFDRFLQIDNHESLIPQIVLLDINMPLYDGWYMMDHFANLAPEVKQKIKVYICSSSIAPYDKLRINSYNQIVDFIEKPLSIEIFRRLINL